MAARAKIISELASNHGGKWSVCHDLIAAAADAGTDVVKLQLYDAATLRDDDPQKAWLTQCQVDRRMLDAMLIVAEAYNVQLTASVFGIPQAQMAAEAGLTTIKIGSGEINNHDLLRFCAESHQFHTVWLSLGLDGSRAVQPILYGDLHPWMRWTSTVNIIPFHGISQYPTPYFRGLAKVQQARTDGKPWGWSDHGENIEVCKEAALHGATYIERHFSMPFAARQSAWDSDAASLRELRDFCEEVAWEGTEAHKSACDKFLTRWSER